MNQLPPIMIGINAYEANVQKRVGSNVYAYRLLCELEAQTRPSDDESQPVFDWTIYLPNAPIDDMPKVRKGWRYEVITPSFLWTQWRLPLALMSSKKKYDAFLSLGHYAPRYCPYPSIVCIMDLAFLKFPQFFLKKDLYQLTQWTQYSVKAASHVFTISKNSKRDVEEAYALRDDQISIIYPGIDVDQGIELPMKQQQALIESYGLTPKRYIVSVGTIQPRKNMINAIRAFEDHMEKSKGEMATHLVFVGKPGWMTEEFDQAVEKSPYKNNIIVTGFVSDDVKRALLHQAGCSILIGYYEGFGIPALESMLIGVTPVVANTGSLPEVVDKFGVLVDPYSIDSISDGFTKVFSNKPDPMKTSQMMLWAKQFTWQSSAQTMLEVIRKQFGPKEMI